MASKGDSTPNLPPVPEFKEDPRFTEGLADLFGLGRSLTSFDFSGDLSPLQDVISTSPEATSLFLQGLQAELSPILRDARKATLNELAANNQLQSSLTANRLAELEGDYQSELVRQATQFGIADINRAFQNRVGLFGTGLNTLSTGTGFAHQLQQLENQFNLTNYQNRVAKAIAEQEPASGGLFGGLTGGIGGALIGGLLAAPTGGLSIAMGAGLGGLLGGASGALGPQGFGSSLLTAGATLGGGQMGQPFAPTIFGAGSLPGATASNDPFGNLLMSQDEQSRLARNFPNLFGSGLSF